MPDSLSSHPSHGRSQWVRLRTLVVLRWIAIVGQIGALVVADRLLGVQFQAGLCYLVIGAAIIFNLIAIFMFPESKRLTEAQATWSLSFDIAQLSLLLYFAGGLNNPFAYMVVAPVAVGAAALRPVSIAILVALAVTLVSVAAVFHFPLRAPDGQVLRQPPILLVGTWLAVVVGVMFLATLVRRVSDETHTMGDALLATQMALSREQKLTDLGGVVAATAHELGTPLATIKLVSSELADELDPDSEQYQDAILIREQADRCRDILRSMGRAGKDDLHVKTAPLSAILEEAAEPHMHRGKRMYFSAEAEGGASTVQPLVERAPGIIHGLRNLVQNAVDFADTSVWVEARWTAETITVRIADDGEGYPPQTIGRIGDPFMPRRGQDRRPEYEGMGLGLFIAKTLLERSGAEMTFANGSDPFLKETEKPDRRGAIVEVAWSRSAFGWGAGHGAGALGDNLPLSH